MATLHCIASEDIRVGDNIDITVRKEDGVVFAKPSSLYRVSIAKVNVKAGDSIDIQLRHVSEQGKAGNTG